MSYKQASKRKRKGMRAFRAFALVTRCVKCGKKIHRSSMHHYECQACWNKKKKGKIVRNFREFKEELKEAKEKDVVVFDERSSL